MSISSVTQQSFMVTAGSNSLDDSRPEEIIGGPSTVQDAQNTPRTLTKTVKQLLADQENLKHMATRLRGIIPWVKDGAWKGSDWLSTNTITRHEDSSSQPSVEVTLSRAITDLGYELPRTAVEYTALAQKLEQKASTDPLGSLGGALSWPTPMPIDDQRKIFQFIFSKNTGVPSLPIADYNKGTLGYLLSGSSVTQSDLQDPDRALQKLLDSPKAQALGQALQKHLNGLATDTSIYDYVLTAIHLGLDVDYFTSPKRNQVAGYDLAQSSNWGKPPSDVVESVNNYLLTKGRVTTDSAKLATHMLFRRAAPQYLIKDIPKSVTIGSLAWVNLTIAAAAVEAELPGATARMSFAEVMAYPRSEIQTQAISYAQTTALVDWGVANGVIAKKTDDTYTPQEIKKVRRAFNGQLNDRLTASQVLDKEIPTRKELALAKLKERFGDLGAVFEEKVLTTDRDKGGEGQILGLVGLHSLLDIAMMALPNLKPFRVVGDNGKHIPLNELNAKLTFGTNFDDTFAETIKDKKDAVNTTVRHLISQLPLQDRQNFEYGKLSFFKEGSYMVGTGFLNRTKESDRPGLIVRTELNGTPQAYEINFNKGTIEPTRLDRAVIRDKRSDGITGDARRFFTTQVLHPNEDAEDLAHERDLNGSLLDNFNSDRSRSIGKAFVQHLDLDDPAIIEQARGKTTLDTIVGDPKPLSEFLLDLIPFRSAIVNFQKGNYGDAVLDLTLDVFGFLTAGIATAGKLIKIGRSALSSGAKALKSVKVIGAATIGILNPTSGLRGVASTGIHLLGTGSRYLLAKGHEVVNALKGANSSYDLLKAASKTQDVVATGTYKIAGSTYEAGAVMSDGKWYLYNPVTGRGYGKSLPVFNAQSVAMGGVMQEFKVLGTGLGMSADQTKRGLRLTLDAHGNIPNGQRSAVMSANGTELTPSELLDILKAQGIKLDKYAEIRLTMCYSGSGGAHSFAAQFAKLTKKPVEGFEGKMHIDSDTVDDVVTRVFANKAKMRDFIDENIINKSKHSPIKYDVTGKTPDGRNILEHSPDYNPVRFDSNGIQLPAKPRRAPITEAAARPDVELPSGKTSQPTIDFDDYDDLT